MDIIGLISFVVFLALLVALSYTAIAFGVKSKRQQVEIVQLKVDNAILRNKLLEAIEAKDAKSLEQTDGFVKFLSESRDWAFKYIEDVQQSIQQLKNSVESGYPIEEEIEKIFNLLPNNKENNNE